MGFKSSIKQSTKQRYIKEFIELVQRGSGLENLTDAEKKGNIEFQKVLNINSITSKF